MGRSFCSQLIVLPLECFVIVRMIELMHWCIQHEIAKPCWPTLPIAVADDADYSVMIITL